MLSFQIFISTIAGTSIMLTVAILLSGYLYLANYPKDFYTILSTSVGAMFTTETLKYIFKVPRPLTMLVQEDSYRFPSAHATLAAVVMSLVSYYTCHHIKNPLLRNLIYILSISWFLLVSYSRIYLHAHVFIDVLVGGIIGVVSTAITIRIFKHLHYYK